MKLPSGYHLKTLNDELFQSQSSMGSLCFEATDAPIQATGQRELFHAAMAVRESILSIKDCLPWPPRASDLLSSEFQLPVPLYNFLAWVIGGDDGFLDFSSMDRAKSSKKVDSQVMSIGQDLVYCTRHGLVKTPKRHALAMTVRHLTGSAQIVTILNKFGHSFPYSQVEELDTALAIENASEETQVDGFKPGNISLTSPAIFCYDTNDPQEETLTGKGTTHCTNGIIIQRMAQTTQQEERSEGEVEAYGTGAQRRPRSLTEVSLLEW